MSDLTSGTWTPPEEISARMIRRRDTVSSDNWRIRHIRLTRLGDVIGLPLAAAIATVARFDRDWTIRYGLISAGLVVVWLIALERMGTYDRKLIAEGYHEYRRSVWAGVVTFAIGAICTTAVAFSFSRAYLLLFFGLGMLSTLLNRKIMRALLMRRRQQGRDLTHVLVIGGHRAARQLAESFRRNAEDGYKVAGVWWPHRGARLGPTITIYGEDLPSCGLEHSLDDMIRMTSTNTIIVTDTELLSNTGLKELGWALQGSGIDLLLSPNVVDIAGSRMHIRPVANLPLLYLDEPQHAQASRLSKVVVDKTLASMVLLASSPLLLAVAIAIKLTSKGPILYRSARVGRHGQHFDMLKFRTMVVGADTQVADLSHLDTGSGPLFKMRDDPRVTRVGRILRRYSIDELPQLINVLRGDMSLVGPRPPLPSEVDAWQVGVERRLLVPQGMTGLWQISGRSDLAWEDAVRLDLDYVENWSLTRDLQIIWHTIRAVVRSDGAY